MDSAKDAAFVEALAESAGYPVLSYKLGPKPEKENTEAWARRERYRIFDEARRESGAKEVLTAHHRDDQAETLLLRLLSGRLSTDAHCLGREKILRPFLTLSRAVLEDFAREQHLQWVEDESNQDTRLTRNRLRHRLLPDLEAKYNPRVKESLAEFAGRLSRDETFLSELALELSQQHPASQESLNSIPENMRWRVLKCWAIQELGPLGSLIGFKKLQQVVARASLRTSARYCLGQGIEVSLSNRGMLEFSGPPGRFTRQSPSRLMLPGQADSGRFSIQAIVSKRIPSEYVDRNTAYFDRDAIEEPLWVRAWQPGDKLRVFGRGTRKVQKLFQEYRISVASRQTYPLVVDKHGSILWVPGVARSERACLVDTSKTVLELRFFRKNF